MRNSPELVQKHMRQVRGSSDYGYYLRADGVCRLDQLTLVAFSSSANAYYGGKRRSDRATLNGCIMAKLIPDSQMVTLDDGHLFLLTSAQQSARLITEFLGKN